MKKRFLLLAMLLSLLGMQLAAQNANRVFQRYSKAVKGEVRQSLLSTKDQARPSGIRQISTFRMPNFLLDKKKMSPVTVCGSLVSSNLEEQQERGMYAFTVPNYSATLLSGTTNAVAAGGGVLVDDYYYSITTEEIYGYYFVNCHKFDAESWTEVDSYTSSLQDSGTDLTYDPESKTVYGCFVNDSGDGYCWASFNLDDGTRSAAIAELEQPLVVVAANASGEIYSIGLDGNLYQVAKKTGALKLVGATGVLPEAYAQSGAFEWKRNKLYWAACEKGETSGLYVVDTETGKATLIERFPNGEEYTGLFVKAPLAEDGAPAAVNELSASFLEGSSTGTVSFSLPSTTFAGNALSGDLSYTITANGKVILCKTAAPGAKVSEQVTLSPGATEIIVYATNAVGNGPSAICSLFVGRDAPTAVEEISLVKKEGSNELFLTWKQPTRTLNGGYLDVEALRYKIVRQPDSVVVKENISETFFSEKVETESMCQYWYEVTPVVGDLVGETASSSRVTLGEYCTLPYVQHFDDASSMDLFTVINANGDHLTWKYDDSRQLASSVFSFDLQQDDWLITPPVKLEDNCTYKLSFRTWTKRVYPERIGVAMGMGNTVEDMNIVVLPDTLIQTTDDAAVDIFSDFEIILEPKTTGVYYIGFHDTSDPEMYDLRLDDIRIEKNATLTAPAAVTDLKAEGGKNGALEATLSFVTPSLSVSGDKLATLSKAEIIFGKEVVKTFDNIRPNEKLTATVPAVQGDNVYTVRAYNEAGAGLESKVSVYAGVHVPSTPLNVTLKEIGGKAVIAWEAPVVGEDGGYINPKELTYVVVRANDLAVVAEDLAETTYTDALNLEDTQALMTYVVYAKSAAGIGKGQPSNSAIMGGGYYGLPMHDSFANACFTTLPWGLSADGKSSWWLGVKAADETTQDDDKGLIYFMPEAPNETSTVYSPKISLKGSKEPLLTFYLFKYEELKNVTLDVQVTTDFETFTTLKSIDFNQYDAAEGWNKVSLSLKDFCDAEFISVVLKAKSGTADYAHNMYLDNFSVRDNLDYNLSFMDFKAPRMMRIGKEYEISAMVMNRGNKTAGDYTVGLYENDKLVQSVKDKDLQPGDGRDFVFKRTATVAFPENTVYEIRINYPEDMNPEDNRSEKAMAIVESFDYPTVTDLKGERMGDCVQLTWGQPATAYTARQTMDDFEAYTSFAIDNVGPWKLHDGDKQETMLVQFKGVPVQYLNAGKPMAYQVFNGEKAGLGYAATNSNAFESHSGKQCMAAFGAVEGANDDWLISPELSGKKQFVSFYVKSAVPNYGLEKYEFLISDSDNEVTSFRKVEGLDSEAPFEWTEISIAVPEGTKYFAIRSVSAQCLAMLVDDIRFIGKDAEQERLVLKGYNVYRDGVRINESLVEGTSYQDTFSDGKEHVYRVAAVYEQGESPLSNPCTLITGIGQEKLDGVAVSTEDGVVCIKNAEGQTVSICNVQGKVLFRKVCNMPLMTCPVPAGIYLVTVGGKTTKVLVD